MSRFADQNLMAANALNAIASKESSYKDGIRNNHALLKGTARRIVDLEQQLPGFDVMETQKLEKFFSEQKKSILDLAESNVKRERHVNAFCSAVRTVQQQIQSNSSNENDENNANHQRAIDTAMDAELNRDDMIEVKQEPNYMQVAEAMGVATAAAKGGDDDIEMVQTQPQASSLKCPISGQFMEDAVRNKVCKHVYSKAGITQHISNAARHGRGCECPHAGCNNKNVTQAQLEEDTETIMNVRREIRREAARHEHQQASQATDLVDSDEE